MVKECCITLVLATSACATDPRDGDRTGEVRVEHQHATIATGEFMFTVEYDWDPSPHPDPFVAIYAEYIHDRGGGVRDPAPIHNVYAVGAKGRPDGAAFYPDVNWYVQWPAPEGAGAGVYSCVYGGPFTTASGSPLGGRTWMTSYYGPVPGTSCTLTVSEAGDLGERIVGHWEAVMEEFHTHELKSFSGDFDVVRSPENMTPSD
jgi:hypothetical protein